MKKIIQIILFCFGLFILFVLISRVGFSEIIKSVSEAKLYLALLGVLVYLAVIAVRSFKWFLLARTISKETSYRRFIPLYLVNSLMGNLTPFKSGETATPFLFSKYIKIPVGQGFSIIILDRFIELVVFAAILLSAVFYMLTRQVEGALMPFVFRIALIAMLALLAVLMIIVTSKKIILRTVKFLRILRFIEKELDGFYQALAMFKNKGAYRPIILLTIASWLLELLAYYLIFSSVLPAPFIKVAASHVIAGAATFITFIPAGIGVSEVSVVYILGALNYPVNLAVAGAILADLLLTGSLLITGLIGSILMGRGERNV